jgi:hypothetical protein
MGKSSRIAVLITLLVMVASLVTSPSRADTQMLDPRSMLRVITPSTPNNVMIYFSENQVNFRSFTTASTESGEQITCTEAGDTRCAPTLSSKWTRFGADSSVGNCAVTAESICVRSFGITSEDGTFTSAVPTERIHKSDAGVSSTFNGKTNVGFAGGSSPWILSLIHI